MAATTLLGIGLTSWLTGAGTVAGLAGTGIGLKQSSDAANQTQSLLTTQNTAEQQQLNEASAATAMQQKQQATTDAATQAKVIGSAQQAASGTGRTILTSPLAALVGTRGASGGSAAPPSTSSIGSVGPGKSTVGS